jgi:LysR family transcriptional regulator, glycine cleavage system transcriptional activator
MRLPSTKTLRAFQLAARSGSFKTAAGLLFLTPSAVSHQIRALEEELGVPLFHRGARTLSLTDAGATYLEEIEYLFERLDAATRELRARAGRTTLRLRVASFFANEFLLPRLAALHAAQPEIDLEIDTDGTGTDVHPPDADVSIVLGSGTWNDLHAHRLFSQTYVPACSPALLARTPITSIEQLGGQTLLVFEARKDGWERWAESAGLQMPRPRKRIAFNNMSSLVRATERSAGIGLIPAPLSAERFRAKSLMRLFDHEWTTEDSYYLVHRTEVAARPEVVAFRNWIFEELQSGLSAG